MEIFKIITQILAIVLLVIGIIYRKIPWGQKLLYFALGMLAMALLTDGIEGFTQGMSEASKEINP